MTTPLAQPAESGDPEKWPFLFEWLNKVWADPSELQRDTYIHWLKVGYISCLAGKPKPGQAIFISGPTGSGKTLLNRRVHGAIFGKTSDSSEYLLGRTAFNKENCESFIWAIDDTKGAIHFEDKEALASNIKKHVANPEVRCEAKGRDSFEIPWTGRIAVTCNQDLRSLQIVPVLDDSTVDKFLLLSWNCWKPTFGEYGSKEEVIRAEVPHLCKYLVEWKPPAEVLGEDRYGVKPFHHASMLRSVQASSPKARITELLDALIDAEPAKNNVKASLSEISNWLSMVPSARRLMETEFGKQRLHMAMEEAGYRRSWQGNSPRFLLVKSDQIFNSEENKAIQTERYARAKPNGMRGSETK